MTFLASAVAILPLGSRALPTDVVRTPSTALVDTDNTRLGLAIADRVAANPGKTGIYPLQDGREAFAARVILARNADRSLDLQYYIWRADTTGQLLWEAVWQAAERGVRVRVLLDDANTGGLDPTLAALDTHPNIEVRLFNPFGNRGSRLLEAITDFSRINRRMHNKSFNADNQVAIVGGRNIGDEYFDAGAPVGFADLDLLAVGPLARDASQDFDRYWNSESAYPAASLIALAEPDSLARMRATWDQTHQAPKTDSYIEAVRETALLQQLLERRLQFEWVNAHLVSDDPGKVLRPPEQTDLQMLPQLEKALGQPLRELDIVSPYFVPGRRGTKAFKTLGKRGVQVRVLTNALAATDVSAVHAGYSKRREELLRGGARLYELKPGSDARQRRNESGHRGIIGSSSSSLHAKTFSVDRSRIFVGSFNLDPRSVYLNTEMGVVFESPAFAKRLSEAFDTEIPNEAYEVRIAGGGKGLEWHERTNAGAIVHTNEPQSGWLKRLWIHFLSILPIEWLL